MLEIKVTVKNVFGKETIYPSKECPIACAFADIAGTRTLTEDVIRTIKSMGYFINVVQGERPLCCQVGNV